MLCSAAALPAVAGMGTMRDSATTPVKGRFRLRGHPMLTTVAHAVWISLLVVFLVISLSVTHTDRRMAEQLNSLSTIFGSNEVPHSCLARTFPFFFDADGEAVDVSDRNVDDWKKLRDAALQSGRIVRSRARADVYSANLPCGEALTPSTANHVLNLQKGDEQGFRFSGFDFSIWFARDDDKGAVYVRGQLESSEREALPDRLRLNLDHRDLPRQTFVIKRDGEGALTWVPYHLFYSKAPATPDARNPAGHHGAKFAGTWWDDPDSRPGRATQHFEIRLENTGSITALDLSAERLSADGRLETRVGTRGPIPLHEDLRSYQVTRRLPRYVEFEHFWFEAGIPYAMTESAIAESVTRGQGTPPQAEDAGSAGRRAGVLNTLHRAFLVAQGYEPCPARIPRETDAIEKCVRFSESSPGRFENRIRMSRVLHAPEPRLEDRVIVVESTPVVGYRDVALASASVVCIVLLIWLFANANKRRREALDEGNRAREALEERNASLGKMNLALENYDRVFLHQAYGDMLELKREIENFGGDGAFRGSAEEGKIDDLIKKVMERLDRSTEIFRYPAMVRDLISKFGLNRVSIRETIDFILAERKRDVRFEPDLEPGENPLIPGTCSSESQGDEPDSYIVEAIETVLGNAYEYRTAGTPIIVSLKADEANAIVQVSNQGPTVPEDKLESVFEFGSRFAGAGSLLPEGEDSGDGANPDERAGPVDGSDPDGGADSADGANPDEGADSTDEADWVDVGRGKHLGIGLFITRQIVDGYRGSCYMENRPDGSGVTVTLRLPYVRGDRPHGFRVSPASSNTHAR